MAAASLQLISVFQESLTATPGTQAAANTTPVNPNQAQGATVPQDTVTLTGQAAQGQQTGQNPQQETQFQETVITFAEAQIFAPANNTERGNQGPPRAANVPTAANTIEQNHPAAGATNAATNNGGPQTPQQQLQQLDQALQQLGINPQSISLFNRLALLLYADDPAALQSFVQQLQQQVAQQTGQPAAPDATATNSQGVAAQQREQLPSVATPTIPAPSPDNPTAGANQTPGNGSTAPGNSVFVQFEELQVAFAITGSDQAPAKGAPANPQGKALSVTA